VRADQREIPTGGGKEMNGNIPTFNNPPLMPPTGSRPATTRASAPVSHPSRAPRAYRSNPGEIVLKARNGGKNYDFISKLT
jgi:hypothetical protein